MNRDKFMNELEYLLQDIPSDEKDMAVSYYRDYLEDAGPENEAQVIKGFGSPERIAAIIRADLNGNLKDGGGFTEKGYEDERFREPNFELVKRPEPAREESPHKGQPRWSGASTARDKVKEKIQDVQKGAEKRKLEWWMIALMVIGAVFLIPIIIPVTFGIGAGLIAFILSLGGGVITVFIAVFVSLAVVTFAMFASGLGMLVWGITQISAPLQILLYVGSGIGLLGLGLLLLALSGLVYGRFLPWLVSLAVNFISRIVHGRRRSS